MKKIVIILAVVAAILVAFGVIWDILSATDVITSEFNASPLIYIGGFCGVFCAILASQTVAKGKKDSDKK